MSWTACDSPVHTCVAFEMLSSTQHRSSFYIDILSKASLPWDLLIPMDWLCQNHFTKQLAAWGQLSKWPETLSR